MLENASTSFLWLSMLQTGFYLSFHLLVDIRVVSTFQSFYGDFYEPGEGLLFVTPSFMCSFIQINCKGNWKMESG